MGVVKHPPHEHLGKQCFAFDMYLILTLEVRLNELGCKGIHYRLNKLKSSNVHILCEFH